MSSLIHFKQGFAWWVELEICNKMKVLTDANHNRKAIRKGWEVVKSRYHSKVGNGKRVKFWNDIWCDDLPLEWAFLTLFSIALDKNDWVADVREQGGEGVGNPIFLGNSMIGNSWKLRISYDGNSIPCQLEGKRKTNWVGMKPSMAISRLDLYMHV